MKKQGECEETCMNDWQDEEVIKLETSWESVIRAYCFIPVALYLLQQEGEKHEHQR